MKQIKDLGGKCKRSGGNKIRLLIPQNPEGPVFKLDFTDLMKEHTEGTNTAAHHWVSSVGLLQFWSIYFLFP